MFLISFGCDPEWVLDLDFNAFDALVDSAMRQTMRFKADKMHDDRMVAHDSDGKTVTKRIKELRKAGGLAGPSGTDLANDLHKARGM